MRIDLAVRYRRRPSARYQPRMERNTASGDSAMKISRRTIPRSSLIYADSPGWSSQLAPAGARGGNIAPRQRQDLAAGAVRQGAQRQPSGSCGKRVLTEVSTSRTDRRDGQTRGGDRHGVGCLRDTSTRMYRLASAATP